MSPPGTYTKVGLNGLHDFGRDFRLRRRRVDDHPMLGVLGGNLTEARLNSEVELPILPLEPIKAGSGRTHPLRGSALLGYLQGEVQEHRQVGPYAASRQITGVAHLADGDATPVALVGECRAREPVHDHVPAGSQSRLDPGPQVLRSGCEKQVELGSRRQRTERRVQQQLADALGHSAAARFTAELGTDGCGEEC